MYKSSFSGGVASAANTRSPLRYCLMFCATLSTGCSDDGDAAPSNSAAPPGATGVTAPAGNNPAVDGESGPNGPTGSTAGGPSSAGSDPTTPESVPGGDSTPNPGEPGGGSTPPAATVPVVVDPTPSVDTLFETALRSAVKFYGAQRSGDNSNWLVGPCFTDDGSALGLDLSGGWYDAGDHIKFSFTIGYAAYALLKAYDAFPEAFDDAYDGSYGAPNQIPDILDEVKVAADYLAAANHSPGQMIARVGSKDTSHQSWVSCDVQQGAAQDLGGSPRPILESANAGTSALGAAALAMMARYYPDQTEATRYLSHARDLYAIAKANPGGYQDPEGMYASNRSVDDDLCAAAIELYRTTGEEAFRGEALQYDERAGSHYWTLDHDNVHDLCRHSLTLIGEQSALDRWVADVIGSGDGGYPDSVQNGMYFVGKEWGTLRTALGAAFSAALLASVTDSESQSRVAHEFALSQLNFALGDNSYGRSFLIGVGENPPQNPHHRNACGCVDVEECDEQIGPCTNKQLLVGALVGGPRAPTAEYMDTMSDFVANEVAIDYNAGLVGTAAYAVWRERVE